MTARRPAPRPPGSDGSHDARTSRGRGVGAAGALLVFLATVPLVITAWWIQFQILDTDAYVDAVGPVVEDARVQDEIAATITAQLNNFLTRMESTQPERVDDLVAQLGGVDAVRGQIATVAGDVVASAAFTALWVEANRAGHRAIVGLLKGEREGPMVAKGEDVLIDLRPIVDVLTQDPTSDLAQLIATAVPADADLTLVVFREPNLIWAQRFVRYEGTLAIAFTLLATAMLALYVRLSRKHRRALMWAGLAMAVVLTGFLVVLFVLFVDALTKVRDSGTQDLAAEYVGALVNSLILAAFVPLALGLVAAAGAWLAGRRSRGVPGRA